MVKRGIALIGLAMALISKVWKRNAEARSSSAVRSKSMARKGLEILRRIIETLPPETRTQVTEWKIDGILDAIEVMEKAGPLIRTIRRAPLPGTIFLEKGGEHGEM